MGDQPDVPIATLHPQGIAFLGYNPYDTQSGPLGKRIVAKRQAMGLRQKELARRLGVDPTTLGRWEREEGQPSRKHHEKLLAFLLELPSVHKAP